jgi:serine/threonine-protein kinase
MGDIYAAERLMEDGRRLGPVALKVIAPELRGDWQIEERFKREASIGKAIRSTHVTRVYEFGESDDGYLFLSMELLQGEELFDRVATLRKLPPQDVARIMLSVLSGLHVVHESGFIHRDLKPENIFFARNKDGGESIKLLDFGIAKRSDEPSDPFLSVVGKIYGTPEYIAPEQGLNPDVDERADLYSVGIMMHECLSGRLPFRGSTAYATILKHQNDEPPALPDVDDELSAIVLRSLQKKPRDRYQTASEFAADIRAWYVRAFDDEFSEALRDSANMPVPRLRKETPARRHETPAERTPVPNLMPTRRQMKAKSAPALETPAEVAPPPVAQSHESLPIPTPDEPEGTAVAGIVTMIAVLAIIAALVFMML